MNRRVDLHMHSNRSDGRYDPMEVVTRCAEGGLDVVALTDHDLAPRGEACPVGPVQVGDRTIHVLAGAELSGIHQGHEYHLLVYFPGEVPERFQAFCKARTVARAERYDQAVQALSQAGLQDLTPADAAAWAGERALTRHHLARELVERGTVKDMRQAFRRYVGYSKAHIQPVDLSFVEAIRVAREAGGYTSWAHPPMPAVERLLGTFAAAGLQAIEGLRPKVGTRMVRRYARLAAKHGVSMTGGSDWHGWHDVALGLYYVPEARVAPLMQAMGLS